MSCTRVLLAIIFPPLAVVDKGCGSFLIVFILTCCGWIPGVIAALVILNNDKGQHYNHGYNQGYNQGYNKGYNQGSSQNLYGNNQPNNANRNSGWKGW
ncbi:MAG: YqaE/Pmp3 family membrane protein [Bacteroidales bacterium]|nr:YqaE/Pmp3 family membrane protein [Bacteroidales bacterium]